MTGIGNRPPERYTVRRDTRAGTDPWRQWYVYDAETDHCIRFFANRDSAYGLLRRLKANPAPTRPGR